VSAGLFLRLLTALAGALAITLCIFLFMQGLIQRGEQEDVRVAVYREVEVLHPEPEQREPDVPREATPQATPEPLMPDLAISPPTPQPVAAPQAPVPDLAVGDIALPAAGEGWAAPVAGGAAGADLGQDASGFVEVVPFDTRNPNVPEVAWQNHIDGWVLVAFNLTPDGRTRNVRVLDASPRGVFEEKVIAAVRDWRYQVNFRGKPEGELVLTQRVEVNWKNYPQNVPHVD
jgi:periplasmic protein TonB